MSKAMGNKRTLEWHMEGLKNWQASLQREQERIDNLVSAIEQNRKKMEFYAYQIQSAIKQKKDGFDRDRFCVKKETKNDE